MAKQSPQVISFTPRLDHSVNAGAVDKPHGQAQVFTKGVEYNFELSGNADKDQEILDLIELMKNREIQRGII